MINIAAFIDVKDNKLTSRSSQMVLLAQEMQRKNRDIQSITFYTIDSINSLDIPPVNGAKLVSINGISEAGILTSDQLDSIINQFKSDQINCIVGYKNLITDQILPAFSAKTNLPMIGQILSLDLGDSQINLKQSIFSGKATSTVNATYASILSFNNAFEFGSAEGQQITIESNTLSLPAASAYQVIDIHKASAGINLADATYVVGAGRGLKGPENWGIIEELAAKIGAATACSKPVSDVDWRPHSEHVGQTGIKIAPKLYIACGISGAIQHLAGVNGSKTIVVINNDPEAPFFKYADYGIVGDVFEVVPALIKNL